MRIQAHHVHITKRQADAAPTAAGIGGATVAAAGDAGPGSLLLDGDTAGAAAPTASLGLVAGSNAVVTITQTSAPTPTASSATNSAAAGQAKADGMQSQGGLGTGPLVGIIVAAFAGALLLILLVYLVLRRRWAAAVDAAQRQRAAQPWAKLDGGDGKGDGDVWEGMAEKPSRAPSKSSARTSAAASLFRKASSTRSEAPQASRLHTFDPSTMPNFAQYHPELAAEMSAAPARPFAEDKPTQSWGGSTKAGTDSFLSLRLSDSSLSPALMKSVPRPHAAPPAQHRWESAEVLTMDSASSYSPTANSPLANSFYGATSPFADDASAAAAPRGNPFFGGGGDANPFADQPRRVRAASEARASEDAPSVYPLPVPALALRRGSTDSVETVRAGAARPDSAVRPLSADAPATPVGGMQGLLAALNGVGAPGARASVGSGITQASRSSVGSGWGGQAM